jgi:hypothetical protein
MMSVSVALLGPTAARASLRTDSTEVVKSAARPAGSEAAVLAASALEVLAPQVRVRSHEDGLKMAFRAYYAYRAEHAERVKKPYLYYVDYGLDNRTPRGYVFDMEQLTIVDGPFIVAHGRGSSNAKDGIPMHFSNAPGTGTTSLGLYVTQETYGFTGHNGGSTYSSIGLRLSGVSGRFNSTARDRGVVVHGAPYVTSSGSGRSLGCPAMEQFRAQKLIPKIANGALVFLFSPNDEQWMRGDPWANAD